MKNIEDINRESVKRILASKKIADFSPGDTIKVGFTADRCHLFDKNNQAFK